MAFPPAISNLQISVTPTTATVSWVTDQPASSRVDYGLTTGYELGFVEDHLRVLQHTVTISNLAPGTLHHAKITSVNVRGKSRSSSDQEFTTSPQVPVIDDVAAAATLTDATITWTTDIPATSRVDYGLTDGHELGFVEDPALVTNHQLIIGGLAPSTTYHYQVTSVSQSGGSGSSSDATFTTQDADASGIFSDDFDAENLDRSHWSFVNPLGDGTLNALGGGTSNAQISLAVPAGTEHVVWADGNQAPRIMQPANNVDFEIETKFESLPTQRFQIQGMIVEQEPFTFMRMDFYSTGGDLRLFCASFDNGAFDVRTDQQIAVGSPIYMRMTRQGDQWTLRYSYDGQTFTTAVSFTEAITVTAVGIFAANEGAPAPAHTAIADYFFSNASRVDPEDGSERPDQLAPLIHRQGAIAGQAALLLTWATDEPSDSTVQYGLTDEYELGSVSSAEPGREHSIVIPELTPSTVYHYRVLSQDALGQVAGTEDATLETASDADPIAPDIDLWYGREQSFGQLGKPQPWINVLGNVHDPDGVASLTYSLNGGPDSPLSLGPDTRRLAQAGDFNVEMAAADLHDGENVIVITAVDTLENTSHEIVVLDYTSGTTWPLPYSLQWSSAAAIGDVAQVVDGLWALESDSVRPLVLAYDRLVGMGDLTWTDYEVSVPITIHGIDPGGYLPPSNNPGVGLLLRWPGHTQDGSEQPREGYNPLGAIGFFRYYQDGGNLLQIYGNDGVIYDDKPFSLDLEVRYVFKMRVETIAGVGGLYSFKVWRESDPEPPGWDLTGQATLADPQSGSVLLVAHHVDASFGDVTIVPLP